MTDLINSSKALGKSGTELVSGIYTEEYLSQLQGNEAAEVYNKMYRSDAQIVQMYNAVINPIKSAKWFIEPASDDNQDLEKAALIEQIILKDLDWSTKLNEILSYIKHGYSIMEVVHANKQNNEIGQYTGLAQLGFRAQPSIEKWLVDKTTGNLISVEQNQAGDIEVQKVNLPYENLLIFFNQREGDNNGYSMFRSLYGPYKRKLLLKEIQMIGVERFAIPTPMFGVPANVDPNSVEYKNAKTVLANFSSGEDSYLLYPESWGEPKFPNTNFDPTKIQSVVSAENSEMAKAFSASFLQLGSDGNTGAYALSNDLSDFFLSGIEQFANVVLSEINSRLIPNLMKLNYGENLGTLPELKVSGISDKAGKELSEIIKSYLDSGAITKDELLEDHIRKVHNLPKKQEGELVENQETNEGEQNEGNNVSSDQDVTTSSDVPNDSGNVQLKDYTSSISLAEAKTPRALMKKSEEKILQVIQLNLVEISKRLIKNVMRKYPEQGTKAIKDLKAGGEAKLKRELKAAFIDAASQSLALARKEIPKSKDVKLSDKITGVEIPEGFKFNSHSELPKHTQLLIENLATTNADARVNDIKNAVAYQFTSSEATTNDADIIQRDLEDRAETEIGSGTVKRAAANASSQVINDARNAFFFEPEVLQNINAFKFENPDPKTQICIGLNGKIMNPNDAGSFQYAPPLHHNCKSYLIPIVRELRSDEEITGFNPTDAQVKSITLKD